MFRGVLKKQIQKGVNPQIKTKKSVRREWNKVEDQKLKQIIEQNGTNWKVVCSAMEDRNPSQCAQRWKRLKPDSEKNRKGWTQEEDDQLIKLIYKYEKNWSQIAKVMTHRSGKQIRERFVNQLDPEIKIGDWSQDEDLVILGMFQKVGSKWTEMSKMLNGRPENSIKNRFYSYIRQAYMNIENPYYVLPEKNDEKKKKKISPDLVKIEHLEQTVPQIIQQKQRSLSFDSMHLNIPEVRRSKFQYQNIKQQFNEFLNGTHSSKDSKKSSLKPEEVFPTPAYRADNHLPLAEFNPEVFLGAYNQPLISYSLNSEVRNPYRNNLNGSLSLQMSSGGLGNPMAAPFQFYKRSLGMSEEAMFSNQMSGDPRALETISFFQHPFQQLFNTNVIAIPVLMRNDLDILGMQLENIKINEKK